jgi:hypothetical protein
MVPLTMVVARPSKIIELKSVDHVEDCADHVEDGAATKNQAKPQQAEKT